MKLMKGETIEIDKDLRAYLMEVNLKLGNVELASHLISETTTEININNAIERLQYKSISGVDFKSEIDFIASNFEAFSNESYQKLDQNLLEMILTSSSFRIESEDSFYEKIKHFQNHGSLSDELFYFMVQYVRCEYLNKEDNLNDYLSLLESHKELFWNSSLIWDSIRSRLLNRPNYYLYSKAKQRHHVIDHFSTKDGNVFKELTKKSKDGKNPLESEEMSISSSYGLISAKHLIPGNSVSTIIKKGSYQYPWILVDLKNRKIKLNDFHVVTQYNHYITHEIVEGSNDCQSWTLLKERKIERSQYYGTKIYIDKRSNFEENALYRYIRLSVKRIYDDYGSDIEFLTVRSITITGELFTY
ncbi:hypothetical protein TRFO_27552 [Tritrichomonas foetus]|uniref:BACK domain-containing protein n=1 Tax=Tritrichomonas foetus TaxID=1144522 RepID=A0A1J4K5Y2_9EUKA|nr:hypothetical protein TRFO_27552 [Tritrichomonas foetus]|eukprot:OHT04877.1 hypothetical protein TRFO_27552 [Tritrichomonas foetus]